MDDILNSIRGKIANPNREELLKMVGGLKSIEKQLLSLAKPPMGKLSLLTCQAALEAIQTTITDVQADCEFTEEERVFRELIAIGATPATEHFLREEIINEVVRVVMSALPKVGDHNPPKTNVEKSKIDE